MHKSVISAWPAFATKWEGRVAYMYLDTKDNVTTGTGNLLSSVEAALALPWLTRDNKVATPTQVTAEWKRVKAMSRYSNRNGYDAVWKDSAQLHLTSASLDKLLLDKTAAFWSRLLVTAPALELAPADAQLAIMDEAWQNGPAFLDLTNADRSYVWAGTRSAVLGRAWALAAASVPGSGARADWRKRLFRNADLSRRVGADPATLWLDKTPTGTHPAAPDSEDPTVPQGNVYYSTQWKSRYVWYRGGWVTPRTAGILNAVTKGTTWGPINLSQGGLSTGVAASASTHAGLDVIDIKVGGKTKGQVWDLCRRLLRSGILPFPRGYTNDTFQNNKHIHAITIPGSHAHWSAKNQVAEYRKGGDGLVGSRGYTGPSTKLDTWENSPYNADNIKVGKYSYYVNVDKGATLLGLNVDRVKKTERARGYHLTGNKLIKRWGRWNLVTPFGTFYAVSFLSTVKPK